MYTLLPRVCTPTNVCNTTSTQVLLLAAVLSLVQNTDFQVAVTALPRLGRRPDLPVPRPITDQPYRTRLPAVPDGPCITV